MATVLTSGGADFLIDVLDGTATGTWYTSTGTGAGTAAAADTTLFTEVTEARATGTRSQPATNKIRVVGTQTYTASKTITNGGTLNSSTGGTLIVKGDFAGIAVANNDKIELTVDLTIS